MPYSSLSTILCCYSIRHWQKIHVFWRIVCLLKTIRHNKSYNHLLTEALLLLATLLRDGKPINIEVCRVNEAHADCIFS